MDFEIRAQPALKKKADKHIVLGVVYEPDVRDTDGNFMTAEEIEKMAYRFMEELRNTAIDREHNGETGGYGTVVESFIAREGDPDFPRGAWVLGVHVTDARTWEAVENGEITGFSLAGKCTLLVEINGFFLRGELSHACRFRQKTAYKGGNGEKNQECFHSSPSPVNQRHAGLAFQKNADERDYEDEDEQNNHEHSPLIDRDSLILF